MADYTCHAFPDDNKPVDSFLTGLIAVAVGLPVTLFIASCFEIANDAEQPESWLVYRGVSRLLLGWNAHRRWHYTARRAASRPPGRFLRWWIRSSDAPKPETLSNLLHAAWCALTGATPRWEREARAAAATAARGHAKALAQPGGEAALEVHDMDSHPASEGAGEGADAASLALYKRFCAAVGVLGTAAVWVVFAWFIFAYGMLCYKLLGDGAETSFARSWGVSFGLGCASDWRDVLKEAVQNVVVLVVLERLFLTKDESWLEEHMQYMSLQALLFRDAAAEHAGGAEKVVAGGDGGGVAGSEEAPPPAQRITWWGIIATFVAHTKRLSA